jgi:hypothetical protein
MPAATCTLAVQTALAEAKAAYHAIMTGRQAVEVTDQNGEKVRFNSADSNKLANYIRSLEALCPPDDTPAPYNGPAGFIF